MSIDIYDREGNPITMERFSELLEDYEYRRVASTDVGPYWVSTVWLGLDHGFGRGSPLIFETMVFPKSQREEEERTGMLVGLHDIDVVRYSTEHEARQGHDAMVLLVEAVLQEDPPTDENTVGNGHPGAQK